MTIEDQILRLPDAFAKDPESIIYKLLKLDTEAIDELRAVFGQIKIQAWRSIDDAEGATLDLIGYDLVLPRGGMDDIQYRRRLKLRVSTALSSGTINRFNEIFSEMMGEAYLGLQEGWTEIPTWYTFFDGSGSFGVSDDLFDGGNPHPIGPPEPASVIIYEDPMILFESVRLAYIRAGIPYTAHDIIKSVDDLKDIAQQVAAGGVRVKWQPIFRAFLTILFSDVARTHLTHRSGCTSWFDGGRYFDDSEEWFDGGYTAVRVRHSENRLIEHRAVVTPHHLFIGASRFNGDVGSFDGGRGFAIQDPRFIIDIPGATDISASQNALSTICISSKSTIRFDGTSDFSGQFPFSNLYPALSPAHTGRSEIGTSASLAPVSQFNMHVSFDGTLLADGVRPFAVHDPCISIEIPGDTAIDAIQQSMQSVVVASQHIRFDGGLRFDGHSSFLGRDVAVKVDHETSIDVEQRAIVSPRSRFDMTLPFEGLYQFDGIRDFVGHSMALIVE